MSRDRSSSARRSIEQEPVAVHTVLGASTNGSRQMASAVLRRLGRVPNTVLQVGTQCEELLIEFVYKQCECLLEPTFLHFAPLSAVPTPAMPRLFLSVSRWKVWKLLVQVPHNQRT